MDHYTTLGVPRYATTAQIKASWRKLARKHHPDREGGDEKFMAQVNEAYRVLNDPELRKRYDETGESAPQEEKQPIEVVMFTKLVRNLLADEGNIITNLLRELEGLQKTGRQVVRESKKELNALQKRVRAISGPNNLLVEIIEAKINEVNAEIEYASEKNKQFQLVHDMVMQYSSSEQEVDQPQNRTDDFITAMMRAVADDASRMGKTDRTQTRANRN